MGPRSAISSPGHDTDRVLGWGAHGWAGNWLVNGSSSNIVRFDVEEESELSEEEHRAFEKQLDSWQGKARVAVLSDYGYGAVQPGLMQQTRSALAPDGSVLCDSRHRLPDFVGLDGDFQAARCRKR